MPSRTVPNAPSIDASSWSEEQQKQFLEALMGASPTSFRSRGLHSSEMSDTSTPGEMIPADLSLREPGIELRAGVAPTPLRKLMPLVHLITIWVLLGYFVLFQEPKLFQARVGSVARSPNWGRWAELYRTSADAGSFLGIHVVVRWANLSSQKKLNLCIKAILLGVHIASDGVACCSHTVRICECVCDSMSLSLH